MYNTLGPVGPIKRTINHKLLANVLLAVGTVDMCSHNLTSKSNSRIINLLIPTTVNKLQTQKYYIIANCNSQLKKNLKIKINNQ